MLTAKSTPRTTAEVLAHYGRDPHRILVAIEVFAREGQVALDDHDHALANRMFEAICRHNAALIQLKRRAH